MDDVDRLVDEVSDLGLFATAGYERDAKRLARIVRELLALHPVGECVDSTIQNGMVFPCSSFYDEKDWCVGCRARALRERLCRIARGEK